ncbi:MAG: ABC transporter permease [Propionibacteriaceae bacterium]|jgi:ABC-2 type transport system permease protein|nr:ABC transporter permease [Propionibacteriaceae bacterium]
MTSSQDVTPARPTPAEGSRRQLGWLRLAWLVGRREITVQLRSRAFIVSAVILLVVVAAAIVVPSLLGGDDDQASGDPVKVALDPQVSPPAALSDPALFELTTADSADQAVQLVRDQTVDAALVASPNDPGGLGLVALEEAPAALTAALQPPVALLDQSPFGQMPVGYIMSLVFGLLFMMVAMVFGQTIAVNTVVEKQTRVVEILLAAVPDRALLGGKVLGNSILALGETLLVGLVALACLQATGQNQVLDLLVAPIAWYVVFFVIGFVFLASLYAGLASLVSRMEDVGNAVTPVTMLIMAPYMVVLIFNENQDVMNVLSYIPIMSTVAMPVRQILGQGQWWEALVSLVILTAATLGAVLLGARIYSRSILHTGKGLKLVDALRNRV